MNTCKHCGFTGESDDFVRPKGKVCKECRRAQISKYKKKYRKNNCEKISKDLKYYYQKNKERLKARSRKHGRKNREKIIKNKKVYYRNNREEINKKDTIKRRKNGSLPWTEIKSLRLGLYIEQAIAAMFGVPTEQYGNPGVDFICPNRYKIQVKTASITYSHDNPRWTFKIKKNKIVDYFILVAVNNTEDIDKEDFKPTHIWMMKGNILNKQSGTSVTPSRVSKWNKYSIIEKYENRFIKCCTTIKENKLKDTTK